MHCHGTAVQLDRRVFAGKPLLTWSAGLLEGDAMAHWANRRTAHWSHNLHCWIKFWLISCCFWNCYIYIYICIISIFKYLFISFDTFWEFLRYLLYNSQVTLWTLSTRGGLALGRSLPHAAFCAFCTAFVSHGIMAWAQKCQEQRLPGNLLKLTISDHRTFLPGNQVGSDKDHEVSAKVSRHQINFCSLSLLPKFPALWLLWCLACSHLNSFVDLRHLTAKRSKKDILRSLLCVCDRLTLHQ